MLNVHLLTGTQHDSAKHRVECPSMAANLTAKESMNQVHVPFSIRGALADDWLALRRKAPPLRVH
jgi:hypothetical protein